MYDFFIHSSIGKATPFSDADSKYQVPSRLASSSFPHEITNVPKATKANIMIFFIGNKIKISAAKLLQKSEMRKDIVIELSYKGFG